jgi:hypothetical protein
MYFYIYNYYRKYKWYIFSCSYSNLRTSIQTVRITKINFIRKVTMLTNFCCLPFFLPSITLKAGQKFTK